MYANTRFSQLSTELVIADIRTIKLSDSYDGIIVAGDVNRDLSRFVNGHMGNDERSSL